MRLKDRIKNIFGRRNTFGQENTVDPVSHISGEPVYDWFTEDAYDRDEELGEHSDRSPNYGEALEEMDGRVFNQLDGAGMSVSDEMREKLLERYRIVEVDNGTESVKAAYLDYDDNIGEVFSELLEQETYRDDEGDLTVADYSVELAVDRMYEEVRSINDELREEGVDIIGAKSGVSVAASNKSSHDNRSAFDSDSMIGWGEPGVNTHVSHSIIDAADRDTLQYGIDREKINKVEEEADDRMEFYPGNWMATRNPVVEVQRKLDDLFDKQDEVEYTIHQAYTIDGNLAFHGDTFEYQRQDEFQNRNITGLREFDDIASEVEKKVRNSDEA